jgi:hypothetical protein
MCTDNVIKTAFIKSYETAIMIRKINANLLKEGLYFLLMPVLAQKALMNIIVDIMRMNSVAVYSAACVAICSNILTGRNRTV